MTRARTAHPHRHPLRSARVASWKRSAEDRDCGAAAFATIASHHGHHLTVEQARDLVQTDRTGTSMVHICQAGRAIGFDARGAIGTYEGLAKVAVPAILHLGGGDGHFLVLTKWSKRGVRVIDPSVGPVGLRRDELEAQWSGYLVEFVPTEAFDPKAPDVVPGRIIRETVSSSSRSILACIALMAAGTGLGILSARFLANAIGLVGGGANRSDDIAVAGALLAALGVVVGLSQLGRMLLITRVGLRWQTDLGHRFLSQIARLPSSDFEERCVVAFVGRSSEIQVARDAVLNSAVGVGADAVIVGAAIGICAFVAPVLAALLATSVMLFLTIAIFGRRLSAPANFQATRRNYEYVSESPWVRWRLHTFESRMEPWQERSHQGSRRRVATPTPRRPRRSGWSASCARSSALTTGRCIGLRTSSATASSRCGRGFARPTLTRA